MHHKFEIIVSDKNKDIKEDKWHEHYRFKVDPGQTPIRIDKYLLDKIERTSRNRIQNALKVGAIQVDGKQVKPNYKISPNEEIVIVLPKPIKDGDNVKPEEMDLDIRYEDDDIIVLFKPPGLVVHPGVGNRTGTLVNGLRYYLQNHALPIKEGNGLDRPGLVHRIDKNTSGLMVIAKTEYAMTHLAKQFFDHTIERTYRGIIWGSFDDASGTIEGNIGRHPRERVLMHVFPEGDEGKHAITHYEVLEDMYYVSLVKFKLETGRTHQIRVHMKYMNHPLFNDERYDGARIVKGTVYGKYKQFVHNCFEMLPRHALHAFSLGFVHPTSGDDMYFEADPPQDFLDTLDKWRRYLNSQKTKT